MKLLLDECIDRGLAKKLKGHGVVTVPQVDRNLSVQQDLSRHDIAVLVLSAPTNRLQDLEKLVPKILTNVHKINKRQTITIEF